jgi:TetR/AcrR family transcriptional regulator
MIEADRKTTILQAALEVFSEKGFFCATVDAICEKAGIAKGTIYNYFSGKEDLFYTIIENLENDLYRRLQLVAKEETNALEKLESAIKTHMQCILKQADFWRLMSSEVLRASDPNNVKRRAAIMKRLRELSHVYEEIISQGETEGVFQPGKRFLAARGIYHLVNMQVFHQESVYDIRKVSGDIVDLITKGLNLSSHSDPA